jgi:ferric-dicitrate binding protein FerR (iron transport regulator)
VIILNNAKCSVLPASAIILLSMLQGTSAQAQGAGCKLASIEGTARHILHCQKGISVTIEPGAVYTVLDGDRNGAADAIGLRRKALLLEVPEGQDAGGFRVLTPQAIAAVRGTKWAVDVQGRKTSVFVVRGRVAVARPKARGTVYLGPGEGVDVEDGQAPLTVKHWKPKRVSALLARFGL